jgi:hypothetical protein
MIVFAEAGAETRLGGSPSPFFIILSDLKVNAPVVSQADYTKSSAVFWTEIDVRPAATQQDSSGVLREHLGSSAACFVSI